MADTKPLRINLVDQFNEHRYHFFVGWTNFKQENLCTASRFRGIDVFDLFTWINAIVILTGMLSKPNFWFKDYEASLEKEKEIVAELKQNLDRAERQCNAAKDELEEFKRLQNLVCFKIFAFIS